MNTGTLYTIAPDGKSITCRRCGLTSHNPHDVAQRYCGHCHAFHDDHIREFDRGVGVDPDGLARPRRLLQ